MTADLKSPGWSGRKFLIYFIIIGILIVFLPSFELKSPAAEAELVLVSKNLNNLPIIEGNSLLAISNLANPEPKKVRRMRVVVTGYSSTPWETDDDPYITAAGTWVRDGVVANNFLPIGTKIQIPELFGDKIFVVEDRMSWKKGNYQIDIWFPDYWQALNFGTKTTYIEILEG